MRLPCKRLLTDSHLGCGRTHHWWNTYWTKHEGGWWSLRCLFCHTEIDKTNEMTLFKYIFKA